MFEDIREDINEEIFEGAPEAPRHTIDLGHLVETPPMHHINDTVTLGLGDVMPHWEPTVFTSQQICKIFRKREHKPKLMERCFSSKISIHFQRSIAQFKGWIHTKRWATLVFSLPELRRIERGMRLFWNKHTFHSPSQGMCPPQGESTLIQGINKELTL